LKLNTLGDGESREAWRARLVEHFSAHRGQLSEDSQDRLDKNPLRILDSKDARDRPFVDTAPAMQLTAEAEDFFGKVRGGLDAAGVGYELDPHLVRGIDYYRHTAFEFVTDQLGAQGTVIAGGRYDGLIEQLGGPHTPAVGWAAGIERLAMMIDAPAFDEIDVAIVVEDDAAIDAAWAAASRLRSSGLSVELVATGSPRKRYDRAVKKGAREIVVLGFTDGEVTRRVKSNDEPRAEALLA
jgi:histidyl-tRNA synthetase